MKYEEYVKKMNALIQMDNSQRFDKDEPELTADEIKLDKYMHNQRLQLINNKYVYLPASERNGDPSIYPPSHPFYEVKEQIKQNNLYKVFRAMPKGGNLHIHTSATFNADKFIDLLLDIDSGANYLLAWIYLKKDKKHTYGKLFMFSETAKVPEGFYRLKEATAGFLLDTKMFGRQDIVDLLTFNERSMQDAKYVWDNFNTIFDRTSTVLKVERVYMEYYYQSFLLLCEDNIDYVELRCGFTSIVDSNDDYLHGKSEGSVIETEHYFLALLRNAIKQVQNKYPYFNVKLIMSGNRGQSDVQAITEQIQKTILWRARSYGDIIGYDLVSEEDRNNMTDYYAKALCDNQLTFSNFYYFHDGESNWADDNNLYAAYLLGTKRIGHGMNLYRFPAVMESIKQDDIALEICPISNQLLRYVSDLRLHPVGEFLKRGIQCVVCSDDPQILGNDGLTYDFCEIYLSLLIDLRAIKKLIKNSYAYSGMNKEERNIALERWQVKWNIFVEDMLKQF